MVHGSLVYRVPRVCMIPKLDIEHPYRIPYRVAVPYSILRFSAIILGRYSAGRQSRRDALHMPCRCNAEVKAKAKAKAMTMAWQWQRGKYKSSLSSPSSTLRWLDGRCALCVLCVLCVAMRCNALLGWELPGCGRVGGEA